MPVFLGSEKAVKGGATGRLLDVERSCMSAGVAGVRAQKMLI
jgi:hypothetical protein